MSFKVLFVGEGSVGKSSLLTKYQNPHVAIPTTNPSTNPQPFWPTQSSPTRVTKEVSSGGISVQLDMTVVQASRGRMSNYHQIVEAAKSADCIVFCFSAQNDWTATTFQKFMNLAEQERRRPQQQDLHALMSSVLERGKKVQERFQNVQLELQQLERFFQEQQQTYLNVQQQLYSYNQYVHQNPWQQLQPQDIEQHKALQTWQYQFQQQEQRYQALQQEQQQNQQQLQTLLLQHSDLKAKIARQPANPSHPNSKPVLLFQLQTDLNPQTSCGDLLAQQTGKKLVKVSAAFNYNVDASLEAIATIAIEQKMKNGEISAPSHPMKSLTPIKKSSKSDVPLVA